MPRTRHDQHADCAGMSETELAAALSVRQQTVNVLLKRLVRRLRRETLRGDPATNPRSLRNLR